MPPAVPRGTLPGTKIVKPIVKCGIDLLGEIVVYGQLVCVCVCLCKCICQCLCVDSRACACQVYVCVCLIYSTFVHPCVYVLSLIHI